MGSYNVDVYATAVKDEENIFGYLRFTSPKEPLDDMHMLSLPFECRDGKCSYGLNYGFFAGKPIRIVGEIQAEKEYLRLIDALTECFFRHYTPRSVALAAEDGKRAQQLERLGRKNVTDFIAAVAKGDRYLSFRKSIYVDLTEWPESFEIVSR
jgi:hypothetical protein